MSDMLCGRPMCGETEDRIDGYCSVYCRDVHEARLELTTANQRVEALKNGVDQWRRFSAWVLDFAANFDDLIGNESKAIEIEHLEVTARANAKAANELTAALEGQESE